MKTRVLNPKLIIGSIIVVGLLVVNAAFTYFNIQKLYGEGRWVTHSHQVIETIDEIESTVILEETRQRGYIITGDLRYLEFYNSLLPLIPEQFKILVNLVQDNPEQISRARLFEITVNKRMQILNDNIRLMREKGWKAAHHSIGTGLGKTEMGRLRIQSQEMIDAENKLLEKRTWRTEHVYHLTIAISLFTNFICFLMILAFLYVLRLHLIDRNKSESALFEERELFRITINSIGDGVLCTDTQGRVTSLNSVAQSLMGWTDEEARGQAMDQVFPMINEYTRQPVENPVLKVLQEGIIVTLANHTLLIARNGQEIPIEDSAAPIKDKNGEIIGVVLVFRDVTEHKKSDGDRQRLAAIVHSSEDAIISKDLQGIITSWNKAAEKLFGYTAAEAIHQPVTMLMPEERRSEEKEILRRIQQGEHIEHYETVRQHKDGSLIDISLSISPIKDAHGVVIGASKIARDITKQHQLEESLRHSEAKFRQLSEQLTYSNKELEQFAYVASHDLKEPLHTISSFVDLFIRRVGEKIEPKEKEYLEAIKQAALQGKVLVKELLEFSRIGREQAIETVHLSDVLAKVKGNLDMLIKESNTHIQYAELPLIKSTTLEMGQLFQNLIENSIKYRSLEAPQIHISARRSDDKMWVICVKDNGIGIESAYKDRIFDIFERLHSKSDYSGTGIGLAICKKIVTHYGGKIWVESNSGQGALFCFTLPAVNS